LLPHLLQFTGGCRARAHQFNHLAEVFGKQRLGLTFSIAARGQMEGHVIGLPDHHRALGNPRCHHRLCDKCTAATGLEHTVACQAVTHSLQFFCRTHRKQVGKYRWAIRPLRVVKRHSTSAAFTLDVPGDRRPSLPSRHSVFLLLSVALALACRGEGT
jgi:hypothetical protein